jgi:thioredoxin reductase (NADPH)
MAKPKISPVGDKHVVKKSDAPEKLSSGRWDDAELPKSKEVPSGIYDVIVVGGSAAGLTAALFARRRQMKVLVVTKDIGGQINNTVRIENYPGIESINGFDFTRVLEKQAKDHGAEFAMESVSQAGSRPGPDGRELFFVRSLDGAEFYGKSVVFAMGKTPRGLGAKNEEKFLGKGVSYCANCDGPLFKGKTVAVVGGGNAAFDAAFMLTKIARKVYLVHRRKEFRAFENIVTKTCACPMVECVLDSVVTEINGEKFVKSIVVQNVMDQKLREIQLDGVFVEIGSDVDTKFLQGFVNLDSLGQIKINENSQTSRHGVFAAGDVTDTSFKQIIVAAGDGCKAGLASYNYLHNIENRYVPDWSAHKTTDLPGSEKQIRKKRTPNG